MGKSRLQMRREVEAAEEAEPASKAKATKKKATRKKAAARKTREKAPERKRVVWVLYSSSMKEEGRFSYDQKKAAEDRLVVLQARGKKIYFMQLVKELITGAGPVESDSEPETEVVAAKGDDELEDDAEVAADASTEDADFDAETEEDDDDEPETDDDEDDDE
jgi:hypothetical protein